MIQISNKQLEIDARISSILAEMEVLNEEHSALQKSKVQSAEWLEDTNFRVILSPEAFSEFWDKNPTLVSAIKESPDIIAEKCAKTKYVWIYLNYINEPTTEEPGLPNDKQMILDCGGIIEDNPTKVVSEV